MRHVLGLSPAGVPALLERGEADRPAAVGALLRAIERLEATVEEETAALRNRRPADLRDFNNRKSQGLLELSRAMRPLDGAPPAEPVRERLAALRGKLEINQTLLKRHLDAVAEISGIVAAALRDAESDGTYSASGHRRR